GIVCHKHAACSYLVVGAGFCIYVSNLLAILTAFFADLCPVQNFPLHRRYRPGFRCWFSYGSELRSGTVESRGNSTTRRRSAGLGVLSRLVVKTARPDVRSSRATVG